MTNRRILGALAAALGFAAVAAGAFAAHAVSDPETRALLKTGSEYGLAHALAGLVALGRTDRLARLAAGCLTAGGWLFSASLYALALERIPAIGFVTPIGGLLMLAGWAALGLSAFREPPT